MKKTFSLILALILLLCALTAYGTLAAAEAPASNPSSAASAPSSTASSPASPAATPAPSSSPAETPASSASATPAETPASSASATPAETPASSASATPAETPASPAEAPASTPASSPMPTPAATPFQYVHDPRENSKAMEDAIENPDAVYGFSPNPDSARLGSYADFDWTDPEFVETARNERIAYHESIEGMYTLLRQMRDEGKSIEEMARALSAERNRLRLESYKDDPEGLKTVKESNLAKYGNENGPTADSLYEKYGSWEKVLVNAFGTNPGMDACTGLYDDYYDLYVELGLINAAVE